jgi:transposase
MRIGDEPRVDMLRKKAAVLESENERMSRRLIELQRENLRLKGMDEEAIERNLPGLLAQVTGRPAPKDGEPSSVTRPGSEGRRHDGDKRGDKKPRTGHGPTAQPELAVVEETLDVDEPDRVCTSCGGDLTEWEGAEDEVEQIDVVERQWVVRKTKLKKYRCACGGCVVTADAPPKLIKGGRYSADVAIATAVGKHIDHLPLARQSRMAKRQGALITRQALWDQLWALCELVAPLCERIRRHIILEQPVIGADLTGFKLIEKGGSTKHQVWQLSCPEAIYFEVLPSKHAAAGRPLFCVMDDDGDVVDHFKGTAVMDGAPELFALARDLGFTQAGCWGHARRNVLKAEKEAPGQVREFLELVGVLYDIDREALPPDKPPDDGRDRQGFRHLLDLEKLLRLRDEQSRAACDDIKDWIAKQRCIPGGLLKQGLLYIADRWTKLTLFLDDPRIPLDNNLTEGRFVGLAIGRRNYVGARSLRGTLAAGRFYTVVESAHVNGVSGEDYLRYAVYELLAGREPELPHVWAKR